MDTSDYERDLRQLQIALVRFQQKAIKDGQRIVIVFEGRDSAGKDGSIARITQHLSARHTRVVALPKPTDREAGQWYFQRYAAQMPTAGEIVIFNRSWYNRGGVEPVMGFCTPKEHKAFLRDAPLFEDLLTRSGTKLVKLWLDISKDEQAHRLAARREEPLKALKISALDAEAQKRWDAYSAARDQMLAATHTLTAPWTVVRADHKKTARLAIIRHLLKTLAPKKLADEINAPDSEVLFPFAPGAIEDGRLAR